MARKSKKLRITRKLALFSSSAVVVIVAGSLLFWHYHNKPSQEVIPSSPSTSTAAVNNSSKNQSGSSSSSAVSDKQIASSNSSSVSSSSQGPTDGTGQPPAMPTGDFVSNHQPGGGYPTTEQSACNTTPGASCYIKFTSGNDTKTLTAQTTDGNGSTIWNWDAAGFPAGTWKVTAVATLNGQTSTATDATYLVTP